MDRAGDSSSGGFGFGERDLHAQPSGRLQPGDHFCHGYGGQGNTDGDDLADTERPHLRPGSVLVDADGWRRFRSRRVRLDHARDGSPIGYVFAERDLYAQQYDRLQPGDHFCHGYGGQGNTDGDDLADTERPHLRPGSVLVDADGWRRFRSRRVRLDHARDGSPIGYVFAERDLYAQQYDRLQHGDS